MCIVQVKCYMLGYNITSCFILWLEHLFTFSNKSSNLVFASSIFLKYLVRILILNKQNIIYTADLHIFEIIISLGLTFLLFCIYNDEKHGYAVHVTNLEWNYTNTMIQIQLQYIHVSLIQRHIIERETNYKNGVSRYIQNVHFRDI